MSKFLKRSLLVALCFTTNSLVYSQSGRPEATIDALSSSDTVTLDTDLFVKKWIGQSLPTFSLKDIRGKVYNSSSLRGKVVVIDFWSIYSVPCLMEMPYLSELVKMYTGKDVIFLAPAVESLAHIQHAFSKPTFTYTVLPQAQALFSSMHVHMQPTHVIVDKKGIIKTVCIGLYQDSKTNQVALDERLNSVISKLLKD